MTDLKDIIRKNLFQIEHDGVVRIESDTVVQELKIVLTEEFGFLDRFYIGEMDFGIANPIEPLLKDYPDLKKYISERPEIDIVNAADYLDKEKNIVYIFIKHPEEMTTSQCRELSSLMVHQQNCGMLPNTSIIIPGGDWWHRPDFWKDHLNDGSLGGNLMYVRAQHFPPKALQMDGEFIRLTREYWEKITAERNSDESCIINIYGQPCSGKTLFLYEMSHFSNVRSIVTVYDKYVQHPELLFEEIANRKLEVVMLDGADILPSEALDRAKKEYSKLVCTSRKAMEGFSESLCVDGYLKLK